jgi:hypothetical protein
MDKAGVEEKAFGRKRPVGVLDSALDIVEVFFFFLLIYGEYVLPREGFYSFYSTPRKVGRLGGRLRHTYLLTSLLRSPAEQLIKP